MPVYEYECKGCGHEFEKHQRITDPPAKKCPSCGAMKAKRLISRTSFVLKGSGWYNDLYSSASGKKEKQGADSSRKTETKSPPKGGDSGKSASKAKSKSSDKNPAAGSGRAAA